MLSVCLYLHVHQPYRVKPYDMFRIGNDDAYFSDTKERETNNAFIMNKVAEKSYLPTIAILQKALSVNPAFTFSLSFSGTAIDQMSIYRPDVLKAFQKLVQTGRVEILGDTYHHSLAFFYDRPEFEAQVALHEKRMQDVFNVTPTAFRNTELSYRNDLGAWADSRGYKAILTEGWEHYLGDRSPNHTYRPAGADNISLLLKNYRLSDDIAFRFGEYHRNKTPLDAETFAHWVHAHAETSDTINLFMDFETFGEHQWEDTGIFNFLELLPDTILLHPDTKWSTPTKVATEHSPVDTLDVPHILTWADTERDLSAWNGNNLQQAALKRIYALGQKIKATQDPALIEIWRRLQTSDHFYYMCTKFWNDGDVHKYFSPYQSPLDAHTYYMHALTDLELRLG